LVLSLFALLFIITNVVLEFSIKLYAPFPEHSTEKILEISNYCSLFGLLMTAAIIIDILANIYIAAGFLAVALLLLRIIQYRTKIKPKTNNTSSEIEKPMKKEGRLRYILLKR
jgi:hypothetical protein